MPYLTSLLVANKTPLNDVHEILRETLNVHCYSFDLAHKKIIKYYSRNGCPNSCGCGDESFRNTWSYDGEIRRAGSANTLKRGHDSPDRTEESDKGSCRGRRRKPTYIFF